MLRLVPSFLLALVNIDLINSYLLMRAPSTAGQHTADQATRKLGRLSFVVGGGDDPFKMCSLRVLRFLVLPALSLNKGILQYCDVVEEGSFDTWLSFQFDAPDNCVDLMSPPTLASPCGHI
jgi:hypothetical protein